ncbi:MULTISPECIES: DUF6049 family protein [unclassified Microbacterium]|uniref:DUF6049 family protein n=1 Tax=unclassified Microbacterium TaxID=2609290 RepID=UPI000EA886B6|nr:MULTISPECIES: DUF6049 family protein [unclassified Microbacterium]MBT2484041.1 hypothetical protein [Microbacterium sp. ISL-108]RKN66997.1 hypothetical protein D7252_04945 [Microbacterium sp. CGR2]
MSVIPPETGPRARPPRLARRTAVFAIVLGFCGLTAPSTATADNLPADDAQNIELHVAAGLRGTVAPGEPTSTIVTLENESESELSGGRVSVELNRTPLADKAAITRWLGEEKASGTFSPLGTDTTKPVVAGESSSTTIVVSEKTLGDLTPGVYPLRAEFTDPGSGSVASAGGETGEVTASSVLVVTETQASQVGVLVPITATPADGVLLTTEELVALTAPDGALTAQLDGVAGTTAVLAIDPSIIASIRVLGTAAPTEAVEWLTRLDDLPNARFALQFGDADAAVQAQAKLPALLQPTTLAPFLEPTNFPLARATPAATDAPEATLGATPTPTEAPALPDDEQLTEIEGALPGILWPRETVTPADLAAFEGYLGENTTAIVSSESVGGRSAANATTEGHDLLVTESSASASLSAAAAEADAVARQRLLAEAAAYLFLASEQSPGAPVLLGLDRDETRTPDGLRAAISAADSLGFDLSALRATTPVPAKISVEAGTAGAADLTTLLTDEQTLGAFSSILADPQVLLSPERIRIMRILAVGTPPDAFSANVAAHFAQTRETLGSVSIPASSTIQLLTANADLPIGVRNDLPWPVTVQLDAAPTDPRLDVQPRTEAIVQANSTTRVRVPVSARVGSGEVDLRLSLYSPTEVLIQSEQTVRVAVRAEWETIGLGIFGGLTALLIGLGVVRTVLRKRREAAEEAAGTATGAQQADAVDSPSNVETTTAAPEPKDGRRE